MYTLYYSPGAASMAVHQALLEIGAPHALHALDLEAKQHKRADYLKLNPNGMVPTLIVDGEPHYECAALLLLLAERHPEARLAPAPRSPLRAAYLQWMLHLANTLHPAFRQWFYPHEYGPGAQEAEVKDCARRRIEAEWDRLDAHLATHGPCLLSGEFTVADVYATMLMR
ncbi:MAG: glutathione S-transferase family protein, partial [Candidatus Dormibacteria bacterium]